MYEIGYILSIKYVVIGINFNDKQDTQMFIHTLRRRNIGPNILIYKYFPDIIFYETVSIDIHFI